VPNVPHLRGAFLVVGIVGPRSILAHFRLVVKGCIVGPCMDEGRKRVLAIVAGILVALHLNTADDLRWQS
jgi:hypothetical protein